MRRRPHMRSVAAALLAAALLPLAAACGAGVFGLAPPAPTTASGRAAAALAAFDQAFYQPLSGGGAYDKLTSAGRRSDFWRQAEDIELLADAYRSTHDPKYQGMIVALCRGVTSLWGTHWTRRTWNDDIMWMVLAWVRAYQATGQRQFLNVAKQNFDATFARAWDGRLGGGLWWTTAQTQKNNTTNGPAALAACLLYQALHQRSYLVKAERLYGWVRSALFDPKTGALADSISVGAGGSTTTNRVGLSYNYGSFIGAADLLHAMTGRRGYYNDALKALTHARATLTYSDGVLRSESRGGNQNGGGFKGIFSRWALQFVYDNGLSQRFLPWFQRNAQAAWSHRNSRDLMGQDWSAPTPDGLLYSFDCSSAVALLEALAR